MLELIGESNPGTEERYAAFLREDRSGYPAGWRTVRVPRAGHFIQIEQPGFVRREISAFLEEIAQ